MKKYILGLILLILIVVTFSGFWVWRQVNNPVNIVSREEIFFPVIKGESVKEIAEKLEEQGLIRNALLFRAYVLAKGLNSKLKAGVYSLSRAMATPEIADKLVFGDVVRRKITIIEGWNLEDINSYFENEGFSTGIFFRITGYPKNSKDAVLNQKLINDFDFLKDKPEKLSLEGYLFPDTYFAIGRKSEDNEQEIEDVVRMMLTNFGEKLTSGMREEIAKQKKTIFEIVTMASLLEKEVLTFEDKKIVSGILWKRTKIGMPLQVDATISYVTGKNSTKVSIEETQIDSPYNTYKNKGLPLGPIANPGFASILATIYPEETDYLFYLSAPDGTTIFSKNLKEHNIAKAKYLN